MEVSRADGSVIACEVVGDRGAAPVLFCHGLADTRLSVQWFTPLALELGLRIVAADRPGVGRSDPRQLRRLVDWAEDAALVLDAIGADSAGLLGVSGGGPFAAACAAAIPGRFRRLVLVAPLGQPQWPTRGMASGQRLALGIARRAPAFGGWFLGRLAALAHRSPGLFLKLASSELPEADRRALERPDMRDPFLLNYVEAFRRGSAGVGQDLRVLTRPWGFDLGSIAVPTSIHHGDADTTVPVEHAVLFANAIPGAQLRRYPGHGHFSILSEARTMLEQLR